MLATRKSERWIVCEEHVCEGYACLECGVLFVGDAVRDVRFQRALAKRHRHSSTDGSPGRHRLVPVQRG